jgi:polar amino acid transport system substrate-binding protein
MAKKERKYKKMKRILALVLTIALLASSLLVLGSCGKTDAETGNEGNGDLAKIEEKGYFTCGVTIFENMNEQEADGTWTGFESEFAMEVAKLLGVEVKFQEIDWEQKYNELNSGAIDCIWNGFTANSSDDGIKRSDLVDFTYGYMLNQQCIVVNKANLDNYKTAADLKGKIAGAEAGSAGAAYAKQIEAKETVTPSSQLKAFDELRAGAVDFIVVDIVLAKNLCGKGSNADLAIVEAIELDSEIYAVGCRKGSDLTAKINEAIETLEKNGKLLELATKYGFENVLSVSKTID